MACDYVHQRDKLQGRGQAALQLSLDQLKKHNRGERNALPQEEKHQQLFARETLLLRTPVKLSVALSQ
jgi:hypothetical protein